VLGGLEKVPRVASTGALPRTECFCGRLAGGIVLWCRRERHRRGRPPHNARGRRPPTTPGRGARFSAQLVNTDNTSRVEAGQDFGVAGYCHSKRP
jgi:hypothetical protein